MKMKIIFGTNTFEREEHAKWLHHALEKDNNRYPGRVKPKGVAYHLTQFPLLCDDCGQTYWSKDEYGSHIQCKGVTGKQQAGF